MDIRNFFQKIFVSSKELHVPEPVKQKFEEQFAGSLNTEWQKSGDQYEAVFYKNELEHIAAYKKDGSMVCLKVNLPLDSLPAVVEKTASDEGELMNAIQIECDDSRKYELIVRDTELIRYFLLVSEDGEILKKEKL
jgi:hypothetical protein